MSTKETGHFYSVERNPPGERRGYHIKIDPPAMTSGWEDVEGVGRCWVGQRPIPRCGYFRYKRDATAHVADLAMGRAWAPGM